MRSPWQRITARSMTFASSRMLPGHSYAVSLAAAWAPIPRTGLPMRRAHSVDEVVGEQRHILFPFAQRGHVDGEDVQTIEEIGPERTAAHVLVQVAIGRGDDADVDLGRVRGAEALELLLLQHAQQLHLHISGQLTNLVEKDRAVVGELESPFLLLHRAGERTSLVTEQFALGEGRREGAAVDLDHHRALAPAQVVNGSRDELLAGARFAQNQHRRIRRCDHLDVVEHLLHRAGVADDLAKPLLDLQFLPKVDVLRLELLCALLVA